MIVYQVYNKVWSVLFESKDDAESYLSRAGTAASGLALTELYVFDASKPSVGFDSCPDCGANMKEHYALGANGCPCDRHSTG